MNSKILKCLAIAGLTASAYGQSPPPNMPDRYQALIGKKIWFAPHPGCLSKIQGRDSKNVRIHYFPTAPESLKVTSIRLENGEFVAALESEEGFQGTTTANAAIQALADGLDVASTFFKRCFFSEPPSILEQKIEARDPIAYSVYSKTDPSDRVREIKRIEASDAVLEAMRQQDVIDQEKSIALAKKPGAKIGMTAQQVKEKTSWGEPESINRTVTASGIDEQWVYGGRNYLYFRNGKLRAIQN